MAVPCYLFLRAAKRRDTMLIRLASLLPLVGIILNRLNISVIAFQWQAAVPYIPSWMEIEVTLAIICLEIWVFRWVINRMPVLSDSPSWARKDETELDHAAKGELAGTSPQISEPGR